MFSNTQSNVIILYRSYFHPFLGKNIPIIFFIYTRLKKNVENSTWLNVSTTSSGPKRTVKNVDPLVKKPL